MLRDAATARVSCHRREISRTDTRLQDQNLFRFERFAQVHIGAFHVDAGAVLELIRSHYVQGESGVHTMELGPVSDRLVIGGDASFAGTLAIGLVAAFARRRKTSATS
jgi:hypothetical protein